ncbi:hypothetical protein ACL02R_06225 [Streptomyces sp. MS19]|uniref:MmyB family transcriptional regulator n=1 Tax=Streptomyces sp. MS19 TaxID=3385972 RepID=UPI00399FC7DA
MLVGRIPDPAMVTDAFRNIYASNLRFDAWLPIAGKRKYGGNLLKWLVHAPEAKSVFRGEWVGRVRAMVESMRITRLIVADPRPAEALVADLREQPDLRQRWDSYPASELAPDRTQMHLAITGRQGTPGLIHVLRPVTAAGLRLVVITPPPDLPLRTPAAQAGSPRQSVPSQRRVVRSAQQVRR